MIKNQNKYYKTNHIWKIKEMDNLNQKSETKHLNKNQQTSQNLKKK